MTVSNILYHNDLIQAINQVQIIAHFDRVGHLVHTNELFLNMMGYDQDEVMGQYLQISCAKDNSDMAQHDNFWN